MRWRLILEEFGPELKYIKSENNVVADAIYFLEMSDNQEILNISELYGYDDEDLPDSAYPIRYHNIAKAQKTDAKQWSQEVVGQEVLLGYPDFNAPFEIHNDASKLKLGAVISQKGKQIAFYSRKMNSAQ